MDGAYDGGFFECLHQIERLKKESDSSKSNNDEFLVENGHVPSIIKMLESKILSLELLNETQEIKKLISESLLKKPKLRGKNKKDAEKICQLIKKYVSSAVEEEITKRWAKHEFYKNKDFYNYLETL